MVWQLVGRDPGRPLAQTSRPELPASDPRQTRSPCSGKRDHRASQVLHEWPPEAQTTGATDTRAPEAQSRGRSQTLFYNAVRPHASLGYKPPAPEVFVPALAARAAPQPQPATPPALASRPALH